MSDRNRKAITISMIVLSAVLMVLGGLRGEVRAVFNKAVKVCMQCIGIG